MNRYLDGIIDILNYLPKEEAEEVLSYISESTREELYLNGFKIAKQEEDEA